MDISERMGMEEGKVTLIQIQKHKKKKTLKYVLIHYHPNIYELCFLVAMRHIVDSS